MGHIFENLLRSLLINNLSIKEVDYLKRISYTYEFDGVFKRTTTQTGSKAKYIIKEVIEKLPFVTHLDYKGDDCLEEDDILIFETKQTLKKKKLFLYINKKISQISDFERNNSLRNTKFHLLILYNNHILEELKNLKIKPLKSIILCHYDKLAIEKSLTNGDGSLSVDFVIEKLKSK